MFIILNIFLLLFLVSDNIEELDTSLIQVNASKAEVNAKELRSLDKKIKQLPFYYFITLHVNISLSNILMFHGNFPT